MASSTSPEPEIWCSGPILEAVQRANIFADCKHFVDSPLLVEPQECWRRWHALPQPVPPDALSAFVNETFGPPGHDLDPWSPPDHQTTPELLARLPAGAVRDWAAALNNLWPVLGRKLSDATLAHPARTTLLPVRHPFVVPGGRFREAYYWDTYWVVQGLLTVDMWQTAASTTRNLLDAARTYGFVPNGLRRYYLNRSQPPLLTQMVDALIASAPSAEEAAALLEEALPVLDGEYAWWMRTGVNGSAVHLDASTGRPAATLNRYVVETDAPRPESWREDVLTAAAAAGRSHASVYAELAAGAETGWDYSSRWLDANHAPASLALSDAEACDPPTEPLCTIRTSSILAVELNAILYRNEVRLEALHTRAHHTEPAARYAAAAAARRTAMDAWMWSDASGFWHDVNWRLGVALPHESAASYMPLWAGAHGEAQAERAVGVLAASILLQPGGVATTLEKTGQQWDWPNAWPPLQQMIVEGLESCGAARGEALGAEVASRWLNSSLIAWTRDGVMHEKMDATRPGEYGGGGEYTPQVGFGWSNGVVLWMLAKGHRP